MAQFVFTPEEESENLTACVGLANDFSETTWEGKRHGPDDARQFRRLLHAHQEWRGAGSRNIAAIRLDPKDRHALERYTKRIHVSVLPNGTFSIDYPTPWNEALLQFTRLLNNHQFALLGGPCRNRKQHNGQDFWFIRKTHRPSVFCSRHCAGDATKAAERQRAYNNKIEKAKLALRNYPKRPPRFKGLGWKEYLMEAEPSLSKKFLTMAVDSGHLVPP
ncbi:MAG: hypothetical protein ACLPOO_19545 [Terriglobales bacterium]